MPYVVPGSLGLLAPTVPNPTYQQFPLGGYAADVFSGDVAVGYGWDCTPSAVTHTGRPFGLLFLPDATRYTAGIPGKGWPVMHVSGGGGWITQIPRYNVVPDEFTSNFAYHALENGWAVFWTGINGPNPSGPPTGVDGYGTEDIPWTGTGLPVDYRHFDGPGSTQVTPGVEYAHDTYLTYLKQACWNKQRLRELIYDGTFGMLNPDMICGMGTSAGGKNAAWCAGGPELQDTTMTDFRRYSSRTDICIATVPPWFEPDLLWTEANIYGYQWPLATDPLGTTCAAAGWLLAGTPSSLVMADDLSLRSQLLGIMSGRWTGAPSHAQLIARNSAMPYWVSTSKAEGFNYGAATPTGWSLLSGAGAARKPAAINLMTASGAGTGHSPAWQVQMAAALRELDGVFTGGFHDTHSRFIIDSARYSDLSGHTTSGDVNAPYGASPLQGLFADTIQNVEETVDGSTDTFGGYLGADAIAWLNTEAEILSPGFRQLGISGDVATFDVRPERVAIIRDRPAVQSAAQRGMSQRRQVMSGTASASGRREVRSWDMTWAHMPWDAKRRLEELHTLTGRFARSVTWTPTDETVAVSVHLSDLRIARKGADTWTGSVTATEVL